MKHTAIICTRNRPHDIERCLTALSQQQRTYNQIIVIDSSDSPLSEQDAFREQFTDATFGETELVYAHTRPGLPYQRNCGINHASGDIVYFFDDDAQAAPDYLLHMENTFAHHPECDGGMGEIIDMPKQSRASYWFYRFFGLHGKRGTGDFTWAGMTKQAYGASQFRLVQSLNGCAAYRRKVFTDCLFDENLPGRAALEDADMSWRVSRNHKLFFTPAAKLSHVPSVDARESMEQFHAEHMRNYTYFFFKNVWPTGRWKIIAYGWAVIGLFVHALLKRDGAELRGYVKGLYHYIRRGMHDSDR